MPCIKLVIISLWFSLMYLLIWKWQSVVIWGIFISLHCIFYPTFFQMHTSPSCLRYQPRCIGSLRVLQLYLMTGQDMNTLNIWHFFPGLSHLPSPLKQNYSPLSLCLKLHPDHLTTSRLQHQEDIYLKCNKKLILIQWGIAANSKFSYIFLNALELERPIGTILMLPW